MSTDHGHVHVLVAHGGPCQDTCPHPQHRPSAVPRCGPRALSLTRPWTWLVLNAGKNIENRVWQTSHRGTLIVHGALSKDVRAVEPFLDLLDPVQRAVWDLAHDQGSGTFGEHLATGLLGTVELVGCCTVEMTGEGVCRCGPWAMPGQCHWQLANPRPFRNPIPAKGALGLWRLSLAQQSAVENMLTGRSVTS